VSPDRSSCWRLRGGRGSALGAAPGGAGTPPRAQRGQAQVAGQVGGAQRRSQERGQARQRIALSHQARLREREARAALLEPTLAGLADVQTPVRVDPVGQGDHERIAAVEGEHGSAMEEPAAAPAVDDHRERRKATRERSHQRIGDQAVDAPQDPGGLHGTQSTTPTGRRGAGRHPVPAGIGSLAGLLVLASAGLAAGCRPAATPAPLAGFNLVLVNIDALRADHLGFDGYERPTSPTLDELAARGVVFEEAMAASSVTRESVAALLTGRLPSRSGAFGWRAAPPPDGPHLGELLRSAGYRTAFLSNTVMLRNPAFARGFDEVRSLPRRWDLSGEGPRLTARALDFARRADGAPFAMYLHYLDPHAPYAPPPALRARMSAPPVASPLELYRDVEPKLPALVENGFGPGEARFEDLVARYDAEILQTDGALASLVRGLEVAGLLDRTLLVVTADHGEEFLEHGWVEHGWTLHREVVHVPLVFFAPGALAPARVGEPVSSVDVLPSLAELLGLDAGSARFDGVSLFRVTGPDVRPVSPGRPVVSELLLDERNVVRSVLWGSWKYVAAWHWIPSGERAGVVRAGDDRATPHVDPWGPVVRERLYDTAEDPEERRDRLPDGAERARSLRAQLEAAIGRAPPRAARTTAPAPSISPEEAARLRALGYH
jgi:arylsulfatase A-like enzyme